MSINFDPEPLEGFDPEIGRLLAILDDSTREWRENLGKPTVKAIQYQAYPQGPSIGANLLHLIDVEAYWFETFCAKRPRPRGENQLLMVAETRVMSGKWPTPPAEPIEWYYELHDRIRLRAREVFRGDTAARLIQGRRSQVAVRWVLGHVIQHDSYHGGQAVLLHEQYRKSGHR